MEKGNLEGKGEFAKSDIRKSEKEEFGKQTFRKRRIWGKGMSGKLFHDKN